MTHVELDYKKLSEDFNFGRPNRLSVLVHPGYSLMGRNYLPKWKEHLEEIAKDDNCALLVVSGYKDWSVADEHYHNEISRWVGELNRNFDGRFVLYDGGFLETGEHRKWLMSSLGNPRQITPRSLGIYYFVTSNGSKPLLGNYDFFTIEFFGLYPEYCVRTQKSVFPCTSLFDMKQDIIPVECDYRITK